MARCPFAVWLPLSGPSGPHLGGPNKIVHHTTEGSTAQGAIDTFRQNRSDPHFTVDARTIYQHIDTSMSARALRNEVGGVQTNRDGAIQIELVGFAHLPKDERALANVARLCRWLETTHHIPRDWPAGYPRPAKNGRDPGGHNRDESVWDTQGGHYGHCHVPENTHWDPGYVTDEVNYLMSATFDNAGRDVSEKRPLKARKKRVTKARPTRPHMTKSTMPDHSVVPIGLSAYLRDLTLDPPASSTPPLFARKRNRKSKSLRSVTAQDHERAFVDAGSVLSFVEGVNRQEQEDVLYSVQLAQRAASGDFDRFTRKQAWYNKYIEVLENVGWANEQLVFAQFDERESELRMDQAALAVIAAIATQNQLAVLKASIEALEKLQDEDHSISLFDLHASVENSGNFQFGSVQRLDNGALSMAVGAFYFRVTDRRRRFLFFKWGRKKVQFWTAAQRMTLNTDLYSKCRGLVQAKIASDADKYISQLVLG